MSVLYLVNSEISSPVSGRTESIAEAIYISDEEAVVTNTSNKITSLNSTPIALKVESI